MNRNLRSNRAKKEQILKREQVILCKVETEYKLYKILQDWNENDEEIHVSEMIPFEKKKKNKQQYKCNGQTTISSQIKWVDIQGISIIDSDETIYVVDMEIYKQSQRSLVKDIKQQVKQSQLKFDDEDESNDKPIKKKARKSTQQKTQVDTQFSQYEEESSQQSSSAEAEAEPVPKKQRQSRKTEEKDKKKGKKRRRKMNENLKNLKSFSTQYEGTEDYFIEYDSTRMNNKEIIRAAITGNQTLMEIILLGQQKISNCFDKWGPEYDISIFDILFKRQDKKLLTYFLQNENKRIKFYHDLPCQLKEIDTGYNNKQAYGVKLRKVALGRGNREGNNAFVYDLNYKYDIKQECRRLLEIETNCEMYEQLFIYRKSSKYDHHLIDNVAFAIRCGNIKSAKFLIKYSLTNNLDGYGFNYLHHDALDDNFNTYKLDQIKKISITKKTQNDYLITPIHCACINPSEQFLKYFMEQTMEYNIQDEIGSKPIHYAAVSQTSNCLEYLLANGVDAREGDKFLTTPLMLASQYGRSHNVRLLVNTNLKAKNKEGNSAIHLASQNGHIECVKILIENGLLINFAGRNRMTALHFAAAYNHLELVEYLLDEGARINAKDKFGRTPLIMAARNGNLAILSKLLYYGADFKISDSSKNTAIHHAAAYGFLDCVQTLIEAGADQNEFNSWKLKPLNVAQAKNHFGIVKALLKYESTDVNCIDDDGLTLVAGLIKQFDQSIEQFEFIKYIITEKKADINIQDKFGKTCLQHALSCTFSDLLIDLIQLLIDHGADLNNQDKDGRSSLLHAINGQQSEIQNKLIKLLIKNGANINSQEKENGLTPFSLLLQKKNYKLCLELLQENQIEVNIVNREDKTLLHILIENQFFYEEQGIQLFQMVLDKINAPLINEPDNNGFVPHLKLIQIFMSSISQKIQSEFQSNIQTSIEEIWQDIVNEYKQKFQKEQQQEGTQNLKKFEQRLSESISQESFIIINKQNIVNQEQQLTNLFNDQIGLNQSSNLFQNQNSNIQIPQFQQQSQQQQQLNLFSNNIPQQNNLFGPQPSNKSNYMNTQTYGFGQAQTLQSGLNLFGQPSQIQPQPNVSSFGNNNSILASFSQNQPSLFGNINNIQPSIQRSTPFQNQNNNYGFSTSYKSPEEQFQIEIQQRLQKADCQLYAKYFYYDKLQVQVGISSQKQTQLQMKRIEDGYFYQNQILKLLKILIQKGSNINLNVMKTKQLRIQNQNQTSNETNIFHLVFQSFPSISFVKELLQIFPNEMLTKMDSFGTPLHYFFKNFNNGLIILYRDNETSNTFLDYMITLGLDFKEKNSNGDTPTLMIALKYSSQWNSLLKKLLSLGGQLNDVNNQNQVPLNSFVEKTELSTVKIFLSEFKVDPNFQDQKGRTSLHYAINFSNPNANASFQMEQQLIKFGAKCDIKDIYGRTPLFYSFTKFNDPLSTKEIDPFESVSSLLAYKECDVNVLDRYQRSPLHYAALRGSAISGRYMIKMGAAVDNPDVFKNSPIAYSFFQHANFSTMLIDNKVDVNKVINIISLQDLIQEKEKIYREEIKNDPEIDKLMIIEDENERALIAATQNQCQQLYIDEVSDNDDDSEDEDISIEESYQDDSEKNVFYSRKREKQKLTQKTPLEFVRSQADKITQRERLIQQKLKQKISQDLDIPQHLHNNLQTGEYSYFSQAIKFGCDGYEFVKAIQDAINANQFQLVLTLLMKVKNEKDLSKLNSNGQNLFHLFALYSAQVAQDLKLEIIEQFEQKNISPYVQDIYQKLPLHYAISKNNDSLVEYFLYNRKCDPNLMDNTENNAFTLLFQRNQNYNFDRMIQLGLVANVKFKILNTNKYIKPFMYLVDHLKIYDCWILQKYVNYGIDINEQNEQGLTALNIAIKNNNLEFVKFLINQPTFNIQLSLRDQDGKTPIHHVVLPLDFGSYENLEMLKILMKIFDYNLTDNNGLTPLDYALIFDAQVMKEELLANNAHHTRSLRQQRMATSVIATALWPDHEVDFEEDALKFLEKKSIQIEAEIDNKQIVDKQAKIAKGDLRVYDDPDYGLWQCLLSKVDIVNRNFHKNVFYKMQILFDKNRNNYILFTKWGQIGEDGQFQMTPFEDLESTIKEYCKIFAAKTGGNNWKLIKSGEEEFDKKPDKYQLIKCQNNKNYKSLLEPFDLSESSLYPKCKLDPSIFQVIEQFSQVKLYQQELQNHSFDTGFVPIEKLDKNTILKAKEILLELKEIVLELNLYKNQLDVDLKRLQQFYSEINDKSARYYEIIPQTQMRQNLLPLLETQEIINTQLQLLELLLNVEQSIKILLGANFNLNTIHPITYCFNALNIKMLTLNQQDLEFKMIQTYIYRTQNVRIANIFAIERKGEAQKFEKFNQGPRILLWHGSKISNFMSLLALGLKIAPSWAVNTGAMFGKGIYFADQFSKSYNYTQDYTINNRFGYNSYYGNQCNTNQYQRYRYLLLCEVSCMNQIDSYNDPHSNCLQYQKPEYTLKAVGSKGPDPMSQIKMPNGCVVPIGQIISNTIPLQLQQMNKNLSFYTQNTEYIVYDESRVKMRYLVQIDQ
ncbi:unnamed protein product [Paramecium pentaurelia]|uniref:Poly [ADP-ribose] polymerase n=1 Tax=Paramecium pentaurelia TaxID=43138 RepID=A0A8S1SK38_9CILI|nr:unnamed protein product [Paramecium pentaurelia]